MGERRRLTHIPDFPVAEERTVLVIEDDDNVRLLEVLNLRLAGWTVAEAADGLTGLWIAREQLPQVIVVDVGLPGLGGLEVLAELKTDAATAGIPVLFVTAFDGDDDIVRGIEAGAHDYVTKPFNPHELCVRVAAAARVGEAQRALAQSEARLRTAFDAAPIGMAEVGVDGRFLRVNPALCDLLGYSAHVLEQLNPAELSHPDDAAMVRSAIGALARGAASANEAEYQFMHAAGHTIWANVHAVAVRRADGTTDHLLAHFVDVTDRKRFEQELQRLADHDPLTGLLNRRGFERELDRELAYAARYGRSGAVLMLDIDYFKAVNDQLGHAAGDQVMIGVACVLRGLRATDTVARMGGDEFMVLLPRVTMPEAEHVAATIVNGVREAFPPGDRGAPVTVSVGVAMIGDADIGGAELLMNADRALYSAKRAGRDRYDVFGTMAEAMSHSAERGAG